jgi:hypothetical protein
MKALEERGLLVPMIWEARLAESINVPTAELQLYFAELARETVCSAGRTTSINRQFRPGIDSYRSEFLDKLHQQHGAAIIPSLWEFQQGRRQGSTSSQVIMSELKTAIREEKIRESKMIASRLEGYEICCAGDFDEILGTAAKDRGYKKRGSSWVKSKSGIEYLIKIDRGKKTSWSFSIPWAAEIRCSDDKEFGYVADYMYLWCPGLKMYELYEGHAEAVLGTNAIMIAFNLLWDTIENDAS